MIINSKGGIIIKLASSELNDKLLKYQATIGKEKTWALIVKARLSIMNIGNLVDFSR